MIHVEVDAEVGNCVAVVSGGEPEAEVYRVCEEALTTALLREYPGIDCTQMVLVEQGQAHRLGGEVWERRFLAEWPWDRRG